MINTLYLSSQDTTEDSQLLWKAAIKLGWGVQRLSWTLGNHLEPSEIQHRIIYGDTVFTSWAAEALRVQLYQPAAFLYGVVWDLKFRAFISGRKVRTISPYARQNELTQQATPIEWEQAEAFANQVAASYQEPFVLDVGCISTSLDPPNIGWTIVATGPAWGSSLYGCDPIEALKVIRESCISR